MPALLAFPLGRGVAGARGPLNTHGRTEAARNMSGRITVLAAVAWLAATSEACRHLAVYQATLVTAWTPGRFPKQYPHWRPPAQWSQLVGLSHNSSVRLWQLGQMATEGVRQFAESGRVGRLTGRMVQGDRGVLDFFHAPAVPKGSGTSQATFFVDPRHRRVSTMSRLVPSPDWFVGVDSLDLCLKGRWRDRVTVDADPLDAGTDQGLTFTAPRWASQPAANISRISSRWPTHPAASFYYPELERLPRIGYFQFRKLREYALVLERARQDVGGATSSNHILDDQPHRQAPAAITTVEPTSGPATRVACLVSDWSSWSPCSQSCGLGESWRHRQVLQHPRGGARPCPPLRELRWCGSARSCRKPQSYFRW